MNPYLLPLIAIPALITIFASLQKRKWLRRILLLVAAVAFWAIRLPHVEWAYAHPFNPHDGGPRLVALCLGWAYGLVLVVVPVYWISRGAQSIVRKMKTKPEQTWT